MTRPIGFSEILSLNYYTKEADSMDGSWGITDRYPTDIPGLNDYLGGGIGKDNSFEIVVLHGSSGVGKSTVAMEMLRKSVKDGVPQAWMILEDSLPDVNARFRRMFPSKEEGDKAISQEVELNINGAKTKIANPMLLSTQMLDSGYTLDDIKERLDWGVQLFLLDHLQFTFDAAKGLIDNEAQRTFLQDIAQLFKKYKATLVAVSHRNKNRFNQGNEQIYGTGAIEQVATKVISIDRIPMPGSNRDDYKMVPDYIKLQLTKNRNGRDHKDRPIYLHRIPDTAPLNNEWVQFGFDKAVDDYTSDYTFSIV